jgi:hypothetical protein
LVEDSSRADKQRAVEYLSFVLYSSASDQETKDTTRRYLNKLEAILPSEVIEAAQKTGQSTQLSDILDDVLR